jgi:RHS repeat-associated protein
VERYSYTAFGQSQVMTASFTNRSLSLYDWQTRFHGEQRDAETGYYNYGYRYYDPTVGRFLGRDPIEEYGGWSLYGFVNNDGVNYWDLLGLCEPGEKRDCKVISYFTQSQQTQNAIDHFIDRRQNLLALVDSHGRAGVIQALMNGLSSPGALGAALADMGPLVRNTINRAFNLMRRQGWSLDDYRQVYIFVTIEYEECECGLIYNSWEKRTKMTKYGPYQNARRVTDRNIRDATREAESFCDQ